MRILTLEEHVSFPEMNDLLPPDILKNKKISSAASQMMPKLSDISGERLDSINATGISMQVLSVENTDINLLDNRAAPAFAARYNDLLASKSKTILIDSPHLLTCP